MGATVDIFNGKNTLLPRSFGKLSCKPKNRIQIAAWSSVRDENQKHHHAVS